jgi:hypothetical protein
LASEFGWAWNDFKDMPAHLIKPILMILNGQNEISKASVQNQYGNSRRECKKPEFLYLNIIDQIPIETWHLPMTSLKG